MSEADRLFEEIGYEKVDDCAGLVYFLGEKYIRFSEYNKGVNCGNCESIYETEYLTPTELRIISKKCEELGWE